MPIADPQKAAAGKELDPVLVAKAEARFHWVLSFMTISDRFNYEVLGRCRRTPSAHVDTMAVSPSGMDIALLYSPEFTEGLDDEELRWVLSHEVLHVVLHHVTHRAPKDPREAALDNAAADLAINSLLGAMGHNGRAPVTTKDILDPKTGAVRVRAGETAVLMPRQYGYPERLSLDAYRELLRDTYQGKSDEEVLGELSPLRVDSHDGWEESTVADAQIRDWVDRIDARKGWGNIPADIVAGIKAAQTAEVAWDRELRYLLGHMESPTRRHTLKKPSRRVGYPWSGTTKQYMDNPLFAPDTSASVDDGNLAKFLCELNRLASRRPVDFMSWSCGLTLDKPVRWDHRKTSLDFKGRGGTDPKPVIAYAAEHGYRQLIMLTDGEFYGDVEIPPGLRVLWVITCDGTTAHLPSGAHVVKMKHKGGAS